MKLQRLNLDSSWHITIGGTSFVMDPWLIGSEVDGFKWLNEQWHIKEPVKPDDLPSYDFIVITQSYEDHCHLATLKALDPAKPIVATKKAFKRIRSRLRKRQVHLIPEGEGELEWEGVTFKGFRPKRLLDPIYYAVSIQKKSESIFYAPHGFTLSQKQLDRLGSDDIKLLITTFTDFRLPEILGGHVNPGIENAMLLHRQVRPEHVINTHDEQKKMKGLVANTAKVTYPDYDLLSARKDMNFIDVRDYEVFEV